MKPHEEWLIKADHDQQSAKILIKAHTPIYDTAIYHTQQCGEKALKGYLAYKNEEIPKMHDLKMLLDACAFFDESFETLAIHANLINPYATLYRYPGEELNPDKKDVLEAIEAADKILIFVKTKIKQQEGMQG